MKDKYCQCKCSETWLHEYDKEKDKWYCKTCKAWFVKEEVKDED